jgi:hypothetical protein
VIENLLIPKKLPPSPFAGASEDTIDFLSYQYYYHFRKLLVFNPTRRLTVE